MKFKASPLVRFSVTLPNEPISEADLEYIRGSISDLSVRQTVIEHNVEEIIVSVEGYRFTDYPERGKEVADRLITTLRTL